ncbi:choice-of-anchor L domain-containing protein, partial [Aquimarina sp. MMG016]|uniref:choice-of-anchor L domain-containing protein n=1 Tax=Aquimarina sp. MMG016 TaxID=2822690 RepID=UPI001B39DF85
MKVFTRFSFRTRITILSVFFISIITSFQSIHAQNFEPITITGVTSGAGTDNAIFSATSPGIPSLAFIRAQRLSGNQTGAFSLSGDNIQYDHIAGPAGIPDNVSTIRYIFLEVDQVTPIPVNDIRIVINDIDGPNNEGLVTDCISGVRFTATNTTTNIAVDNIPPDLEATGTATETNGPTSRVMYEFARVNSIDFVIYANGGFVKQFDLNDNDFAITVPGYSVCLNDFDNDGFDYTLDADNDNDGILDINEANGNSPDGDADGDGLPNYLDVVDNTGLDPSYTPDGSTTDYTDVDSNGIPDVYDTDGDTVPNHLDLDSDNDGIPDNVEAQPTVGFIAPSGLGSGITDGNTNGVDDNYETAQGGTDLGTGVDTDGDGIPDFLDLNSDNLEGDDTTEAGFTPATSTTDTDGDGILDDYDDIPGPIVTDDQTFGAIGLPNTFNPGTTEVDFREGAAPGCVPGNLNLWVKANAESYADGAAVTSWTDQSGNNGTMIPPAVGQAPDFESSETDANFNPYLDFDDTSNDRLNGANYGLTDISTTEYQIFFVYNQEVTNGDPGTFPDLWDWDGAVSNERIEAFNDVFSYAGSGPAVRGQWHIGVANGTAANPVGVTSGRVDGLAGTTGTYENVVTPGFQGNGNVSIGTAGELDANIAEIIYYAVPKTGIDLQQIESYLAIKYGITLDQTIATNYLDGQGAVIWDATANATYNNDIVGIGRDDCQALDQQKSKSVNANAILTIANGDITTPVAFGADRQFFIAGNNNGAASWTTTGAPSQFRLLSKEWQVQDTNAVGAIALEFDVDDTDFDVPALVTGTTYYLVYDANNNNDLSDETPIALTNSSGSLWETTAAIDFTTGTRFTIATMDIDTDGDGVPDVTDLDDDNDGITDFDEQGCTTASSSSFNPLDEMWQDTNLTITAGRSYRINLESSSINLVTANGGPYDGQQFYAVSYGNNVVSDYDGNRYNYSLAANNGNAFFAVGPQGSGNIGFANLTAADFTNGLTFVGLIDTNGNGQYDSAAGDVVIDNVDLLSMTQGPTGGVPFIAPVSGDFYVVYTDSGYFNNSGTLTFTTEICEADADLDGIVNSLDLDSDNDGIYDVVEAGGTPSGATGQEGRADDSNNNTDNTGNSGIPDSAGATGLTPIDTLTDGSFDFLNLDSDADGCSDANEAYADLDADGGDGGVYNPTGLAEPLTVVAGSVTTTGLVADAAYDTGAVSAVIDASVMSGCDDGDGIDAAIEDAAPNGGDANGDGILDSEQSSVASIPDATGSGDYVTLEVTGDCSQITNMQAFLEADLASLDDNYDYPVGLIDFTLRCGNPGESATVTIYWYGLTALDFYRKFGPLVSGGAISEYSNLSVTEGTTTVGTNTVITTTYTLTDGQPGDDTTSDGIIIDPSGPALTAAGDADGDGVINSADLDDDNDGILDTAEGCPDYPITAYTGTPGVDVSNFTADMQFFDWTVAELSGLNNAGDNFNKTFTLPNGTPVQVTVTLDQISAGDGLNAIDLGATRPAGALFGTAGGNLEAIRNTLSGSPTSLTYGLTFAFDKAIPVFVTDGEASFFDTNDPITEAITTATTNGSGFQIIDALRPSQLDISGIGTASITYAPNATATAANGGGAYAFFSMGTTQLSVTVTTNDSDLQGVTIGVFYPDADGDEIFNCFDLDSDNDGIYDVVESGGTPSTATGQEGRADDTNNNTDNTGNNGIPTSAGTGTNPTDTLTDGSFDFLNLDSDGDACNDVLEAGFTDGDDNGLLGTGVFVDNITGLTVDDNGVVTSGTDGYTAPADADANGTDDYQQVGTAPTVVTDPTDQLIGAGGTANFTASGSATLIAYQWQQSTNGGATFLPLTDGVNGDGVIISGATTATLTLAGVPATYDGYLYQVIVSDLTYVCTTVTSANALLTIGNDADGDTVPDSVDIDDDNDGIPDLIEANGNDPDGDEDGDGLPNYQDTTDNGTGDGSTTDYTDTNLDGIPDVYDTDGDGVPNHLDLDSDNDGIYDVIESGQLGTGGAPQAADIDFNGRIDGGATNFGANGLYNGIEDNDSSTATLLTTNSDSDSDGIIDAQELDSDNDLCTDVNEAYANASEDGGDTGVIGNDGTVTTDPITGIVTNNGADYTITVADADSNSVLDFQEEIPFISNQPINFSALTGAAANFSVVVVGPAPLAQQWEESTDGGATWNPLTDGGIYSGTTTQTLIINPVNGSLNLNLYRISVTTINYVCLARTSNSAALLVDADSDGDSIVDSFDLDDDNDGLLDTEECEIGGGSFGTVLVDDADTTFEITRETNATNLANFLFRENSDATLVSAVINEGDGSVAQIGTFNDGDQITDNGGGTNAFVNFSTGIIFSTGNVLNLDNNLSNQFFEDEIGIPPFVTVGPALGEDAVGFGGNGTDPDFAGATPEFDVASLEFVINVAATTVITGEFVFASEEYNDFVDQGVNDAAKVFVNGDNVALTPGGQTLSIDTVNNGDEAAFYVDNETDPTAVNIEADGFTTTLRFAALLNPGNNTVKIGIADNGDRFFDSWLLFKGNSFAVCFDRDTDGDGVADRLDLDSDNDGIYDATEAGHGQPFDTDGRIVGADTGSGSNGYFDLVETPAESGIPNYTPLDADTDGTLDAFELDSDNDTCFDTVEAGFTDDDDNGFLGDGVPSPIAPQAQLTTDSNGVVTSGTDGYTVPLNDADTSGTPDYREAGITPVIGTNPTDVLAIVGNTVTFDVTLTTPTPPIPAWFIYQWEESTDNGATWIPLTNTAPYSGVDTEQLTITAVTTSLDENLYRARVADGTFLCAEQISAEARLEVDIDTDGDTIPDSVDIDDDNDGIPDLTDSLGVDPNTPCLLAVPVIQGVVLDSGLAGQVGAVYRAADALPTLLPGVVDLLFVIVDKTANASLINIDDDATRPANWQPIINNTLPTAGTTESIEFELRFVLSGTNTLFTVSRYGGIALDVDGGVGDEIIEVASSNAFATSSPTNVNTFNVGGGIERFTSNGANFVDGSEDPQGIFFLGYTQGTTLDIRIGTQTAGNKNFFFELGECGVLKLNNPLLEIPDGADVDNDGVPNHLDLDSDGDGIADVREAGLINGTTLDDTDNDGIIDGANNTTVGANGLFDNAETGLDSNTTNYITANTDLLDSNFDFLDLDSDQDGIPDNVEAQPTVGYLAPNGASDPTTGFDIAYGNLGINPENTDGLADTIPDYLDTDSDQDGVLDAVEGFDTDADGVPNVVPAGADADFDGLDDAFDGTPGTGYGDPNGNQVVGNPATELPDTDGDATTAPIVDVDYRDTDDDNDGILTTNENPDPDGNPLTNDALDSDNDGTPDYLDVDDYDGDGIPDTVDLDDDNDGIPDLVELTGNDPFLDEDGDGILNYLDTTDDGVGDGSTTDYTDTNGDGIPDVYDFDNDGMPNHLDTDSDNDSCADAVEGGGTFTTADLDGDNSLGDAVATTGPNIGIPTVAGSGQATTVEVTLVGPDLDSDGIADACDTTDDRLDTDGDNVVDSLDLDDDNDGILDSVENDLSACTTPYFSEVYGVPAGNMVNGTLNENGNIINTTLSAPGATSFVNISPILATFPVFTEANGLDGIRLAGDVTITHTFDQPVINPILALGSLGGAVDERTISFSTPFVVLDTFDGGNLGTPVTTATTVSGIEDGFVLQFEGTFTTLTYTTTSTNPVDEFDQVWIIPNPVCIDADGDGIPNDIDIDSDNDGIPDNVEAQPTIGYIAPGTNGVVTATDVGPTGIPLVYNQTTGLDTTLPSVNNDTDGIPDYLDLNSDDEGGSDTTEAGLTESSVTIDTDGDGLLDAYEFPIVDDSDVNDNFDNPSTDLPNDQEITTPEVDYREIPDSDGDGVDDLTDLDDDNDGILDSQEVLGFDPTDVASCTFNAANFDDTFPIPTAVIDGAIVNIGGVEQTVDIPATFVGDQYRFYNVVTIDALILDAIVEITAADANITTFDIDNDATGDPNAWQGEYDVPAGETASMSFQIRFVLANTNTVVPLDRFGGIFYDIDGANANESITLTNPDLYAVENPTLLNVVDNGSSVTFTGPLTTFPGVVLNTDIAAYFNYYNISTFDFSTSATNVTAAGNTNFFSLVFDPCAIDAFTAPDYVIKEGPDSDGDNRDDHLDNDSDNDGCEDAIEAEGTFTAGDIDGIGELTGGVNPANGIPLVAGAGQDGNTDVVTFGPDSDNDGIADACDLVDDSDDFDQDGVPNLTDQDDDNDGILDVDEGGPECRDSVVSSLNTSGYTTNTDLSGAPGFPLVFDNGNYEFSAAFFDGAADSGTPQWANGVQVRTDFPAVNDYIYVQPRNVGQVASGDYVEYTFDFPTALDQFEFIFAGLNNGDYGEVRAFNGATEITITPDNFSDFNPALTSGDWDVSGNRAIGNNTTGGVSVTSNFFRTIIPGPITRVIVASGKGNNSNGTVTAGFHSIVACVQGTGQNSDTDLLEDYVDNDSDDDGCPDAVEAAGNFVITDLDGDDSLGDVVDPFTGIPLVAGAGQATTAAVTDPLDSSACLDSDNDGVFDT